MASRRTTSGTTICSFLRYPRKRRAKWSTGTEHASLRRNLAVALTIDTEVHPPKILLLRGEAVLVLRVIDSRTFLSTWAN
jgi:hypothetical protein